MNIFILFYFYKTKYAKFNYLLHFAVASKKKHMNKDPTFLPIKAIKKESFEK
jgi:hypothetical protein